MIRDRLDGLDLVDVALRYAARGWAVFPLVPGTKRPLTEHGFQDATTAVDAIRTWWTRWPTAGVAIATGATSGLVVVDVDPRSGGFDGIEDLEATHGRLPFGPIVLTGGGGTHSYFRPEPGDAPPCRTGLGGFAGVDLKSEGGYVIAPPSIHPSGEAYTWHPVLGENEVLPELPRAIPDLATARPERQKTSYTTETWMPSAEALVAYDPRVRERFERGSAGLVDASPSGIDYSLACRLAVRGADGATIERIVTESRARAGLPPKRRTYYLATVGKALSLAEAR